MAGKGATAKDEFATLRTIGEVAEHLDLPQHVLRFWETRFKEIDPVKRAGGRRFYRPRDIALVEAIRHLLYREGYTIKGVQRILAEQGVDAVIADVQRRQRGESPSPSPAPSPAADFAPQAAPPEPAPQPPLADAPVSDGLAQPESPFDAPPVEPIVAEEEASDARETPEYPLVAVQTPVFNAPVVVGRREDMAQSELLREALAEIEECKRLLTVTRR